MPRHRSRSRSLSRPSTSTGRYRSRSRSSSRSRSTSRSYSRDVISTSSERSRSRSSSLGGSSRGRHPSSREPSHCQAAAREQSSRQRPEERGRHQYSPPRDSNKRNRSLDQQRSSKLRRSGSRRGSRSRKRRRRSSSRHRHNSRRRSRSRRRCSRSRSRSCSRSYKHDRHKKRSSSSSRESIPDELVLSAKLQLELRSGRMSLGYYDWGPTTTLADIKQDCMDRAKGTLGAGMGLTVHFSQQLDQAPGAAAAEDYEMHNDSSVKAAYKRAFRRKSACLDPDLILRPHLEGLPAPQLKLTAELCIPRGALQAAGTKVDHLQLVGGARRATASAAAAAEDGDELAEIVPSDGEQDGSNTAGATVVNHGTRGKKRNHANFFVDSKKHAQQEAEFKTKLSTRHNCFFADKCTYDTEDTTKKRVVTCSMCPTDGSKKHIQLADPYQTFLVFRHFARNHVAELKAAGFSEGLIKKLAAQDSTAKAGDAEQGSGGNKSATGSNRPAAAGTTSSRKAPAKSQQRAAGQLSLANMWNKDRLAAGSLLVAQQQRMQQAAAGANIGHQQEQRQGGEDQSSEDPGELVQATVDVSDMHEDLLLLHILLKSGALRRDHVAWQAMSYLVRSSLGMVTPGQELSSNYNTLLEYVMTMRSVGAAAAVCLFNGVGGVGLGRGAEMLPHQFFDNHNFGNVSLRTITAKQPPPNLKGGPDIALLLRALYTLQESRTKSRFDAPGLTVVFCALAVDGGTLAPAVQYYGSGLSACLAAADGELVTTLVTTADIQRWRQLQQDGKEEEVVAQLKGRLPAVAINFIISPLDCSFSSQLPQPYVGCIYAAAEGSFESVSQRCDKATQVFSMCTNCLTTKLTQPDAEVQCDTSCADCVVEDGACEQCSESCRNPAAALRPCRGCKQAGLQCVCGMDNDSKQLKHMKLLQHRSSKTLQQWSPDSSEPTAAVAAAAAAATATSAAGTAAGASDDDDDSDSTQQLSPACLQFLTGVPDCPHVIKIIRAGAHHWWLLIDGHLACVRMLHALRNDPDPAVTSKFRPVISSAAVRNKDAMNLQTALELGNPKLKQVLVGAGSTYVANTLVPEQLMQWDKNPKNIKLWPLDCCIHPVGIMFMTDAEKPIVRQVQLHCPANVTPIGGADTQGAADGPSSKARFGKLGGIIVVGHYLLVVDSGNKQLRVANIRRIIYPGGGLLVTTAEEDSTASETAAAAAGDGSSSNTAVQSSCRTSAVWGTVRLLSPTGGPVQLHKPYAITGPWDSDIIPARQWRAGSVAGAVIYVSDDSSDGTSSILRITGLQEGQSGATTATATAGVRAALSLVASATAKPLRCSPTLQRITGLSLLADKKHLAVVAAGQVLLLRVDEDSCAATVTATALCSIRGAHGIAANADSALFVSSTELYNIQQLKPASGSTWPQLLRHSTAYSRQQERLAGDSNASTSSAPPTSNAAAVQASATVFAGSAQCVCGAADGTAGNALLASPVGLATYYHNVLVCDKGVGLAGQSSNSSANNSQQQGGRLVLLSHTKPLVWLNEVVEKLATAYGMRCDKKVKPGSSSSWQQAIALLEQVKAMMQDHKQQLVDRSGRPGGQGPELALSHVSRQSVDLMLVAMQQVQSYFRATLNEREYNLLSQVLSPSAVCTLVVENFVAITRKHKPNPSALNHAQLVPTVARELSKRICSSFSYYTGGKQHYNFAQPSCARDDSANSSSSSRLQERLRAVDALVAKQSTTTRAVLAASANSSPEEQQQIKQQLEEEKQRHVQFMQEFCKACRQEPVRAAHTREVRGRDPYGSSHRQPHHVIATTPMPAAPAPVPAALEAEAEAAGEQASIAAFEATAPPTAADTGTAFNMEHGNIAAATDGQAAAAATAAPAAGAAAAGQAGSLERDTSRQSSSSSGGPVVGGPDVGHEQQPEQHLQQRNVSADGQQVQEPGEQPVRRSSRRAEKERRQQEEQQQQSMMQQQQPQPHQQSRQQRDKGKLQGRQKQQKPSKPPKAAGVPSKPAVSSRQSRRQQQQQQQGQEVQPDEEDSDAAEAGEAAEAVDDDQVQAAFHPAVYSTTGSPLPMQPVIQLGDGRLVKYRSGQVVAVVLPPDAASVPLALVELLEDVILTREGDQDVYIKAGFLGRELEEMASDLHHYKRVDGDVRVGGSNITRAVRLSKFWYAENAEDQHMAFVLEADEWDSLALLTLGEPYKP